MGAGLPWPSEALPFRMVRPMPKYTAVFRRDGSWWMGYVEELPGANTQGRTIEEARENLKEAVSLILEANRALTQAETGSRVGSSLHFWSRVGSSLHFWCSVAAVTPGCSSGSPSRTPIPPHP
jgi:predicted RNase H-like HicB family nuclease